MSRTLVITLTIPDGVTVAISNGETIDDFEHEPLPLDPGLEAPFPAYNGAPPSQAAPAPAFRAAATQQPVGPPAQIWAEGMTHTQGHKPLKRNSRGLFCPTSMGKDGNGATIFCPWRP